MPEDPIALVQAQAAAKLANVMARYYQIIFD